MNPHAQFDQELEPELEPERYEFQESGWDFDLGRRDFLRILGGGLLVLCLGQVDQAQETGKAQRRGFGGQRRGGGELPRAIEAWLHIGEDGAVTASTGKVEVGQNARTSLTMAVADELGLLRSQGFGNRSASENGSVKDELSATHVKVEAVYTVAYIAHAPLEPRAAVAEWIGDRLTVWTGTQRPFGARSALAQAFHLPEDRIRVLVPDTGSGYGGKHTNEAAVEAARLARAAGKPVKLVWTREEEFTWAHFRPAGLIETAGGVDRDGKLTAWEFHNYNSGTSGLGTPYKVPSSKVVFHATESPLRQGSYRALAATANHVARESLMDELASAAGLDPLEFRLRNLDDSRLRAVLEDAAAKFGWGKSKPAEGHGFGIAGGTEKGGDTSPPAPRSPWTAPRARSRSSAPCPPSSAVRSSIPTTCATRSKAA